MIGKMQDFVSAAIVANAVDSASRSAPEPREQAAAQTAAAETQAAAPKPEAPVASMEKGQDAGAQTAEDKKKAAKTKADEPKLDEKTVDYMTKELNELMGKINCNLQFTYHKDVDVMSVKMINKETKEVIKEFPPEEMVESIAKAREWIGAFLDKSA